MIDKLSQKNSDADSSYNRLTRMLSFGWQSPLVLLGLTIALCNPLTLNASVSAFIESIKTEIKDKNLSEKEAKSVVAEKCLSLANVATLFPPDESKDSSGNKIVTKGSQEKCVETGMNIANRYTIEKDDTGIEDCAEKEKRADELRGACADIGWGVIKNIVSSDYEDQSKLLSCKQAYLECIDFKKAGSQYDGDAEASDCKFIRKISLPKGAESELSDQIESAETQLIKNMGKSQKALQDEVENRGEQVQKLQAQLVKLQNDIQKQNIAMQNIATEAEDEKLEIEINVDQEILAIQQELSRTNSSGVFSVEMQYDQELQQARSECQAEGLGRYENFRTYIRNRSKQGKGVDPNTLRKFSGKTNAEWANYYANKCINSTDYLRKVKAFNQTRVLKLNEAKTKVEGLREQLRQKFSEKIKRMKSVDTKGNQKLQAAVANISALEQQMNLVQQEIAKLSRPDQSNMIQQMQQQETFMREMQQLQRMKEDNALLRSIAIDEDGFKTLRGLSGMREVDKDKQASGSEALKILGDLDKMSSVEFEEAMCKKDERRSGPTTVYSTGGSS